MSRTAKKSGVVHVATLNEILRLRADVCSPILRWLASETSVPEGVTLVSKFASGLWTPGKLGADFAF